MTQPSYSGLLAENARLRDLLERQRQKIERQDRTIAGLQDQIEALRQQFDEQQRRNKRQAAPFSKGPPKPNPKPPGRKAGTAYGPKAYRPDPAAGQVTESYDVPLPDACPHCGGQEVQETGIALQYQVELPQQPIYRRFTLHVGRCQRCRRRVQGRHALQTSNALGAARSQLGPVLQALLTVLQKQLGLSHGKCVRLLQQVWGVGLTRGGVVQALQRMAVRVAPTVARIREAIRASPEVAADETGWRIGGQSAWLHTLATPQAVSYVVDRSRSSAVAARILDWDYAGVLVHDGLRTYENFRRARHQQCLAHVLRRCHDLRQWVEGRGAAVLAWIQEQLQEALAYRDRLRAEPHRQATVGLWVWCHRERFLQGLARWRPRRRELVRFRNFLQHYVGSLFTFLLYGTEATSWRAEQALRPAVVNRKVWGGNRTPAGANVQSVLLTILGTLQRQVRPVLEDLAQALCRGRLLLRLAS